jgi:hypothetical protein
MGLVTVAVGEDNGTTGFYQVNSGVIALLVLTDGVLPDDLVIGYAESSSSLTDTLDVRIGVTLVLVTDQNNADLEAAITGIATACQNSAASDQHHKSQDQRQNFLHKVLL